MRWLQNFVSVIACFSFNDYKNFQMVGWEHSSKFLNPLCHPSATLDFRESPRRVASHLFHPNPGVIHVFSKGRHLRRMSCAKNSLCHVNITVGKKREGSDHLEALPHI